jgi:hypothetical protein
MQTGDVAVHSVFDGVIPLPPGLLYPEVPVSVWQGVPGARIPGRDRCCCGGRAFWDGREGGAAPLIPARPRDPSIPTQTEEEQ